MEYGIDDVANRLKRNKDNDNSCILLIGAGCSVSAEIPLADDFVKIIKDEFPREYAAAEKKTYPYCMGELTAGERHTLISKHIDNAKINWAHIAIAQLIKSGFVDRVLTTNFDPLVMRACALINEFPAVYDMAASQRFVPHFVRNKAVFHLHGQRDGFVQLHKEDQVKSLKDALKPVFDDTARNRTWIVIGYSGENDPVFEQLAALHNFDYRLFWICYKDEDPSARVRNQLLESDKDAHCIKGFDADNFLVKLAGKLDCFPPDFCGKPFNHLKSAFDALVSFRLPGQDQDIELVERAKKQVDHAIKTIENISDNELARLIGEEKPAESIETEAAPVDIVSMASMDLAMGNYDKVIALRFRYDNRDFPELRDSLSWAYLLQGNALAAQARKKEGAEADELFTAAGEKYAAALNIKPDMHEALNNWGVALGAQARKKDGAEADELFTAAGEKYAAALNIKPDDNEALNNWGIALDAQAGKKEGAEADELLAAAGEKYAAALNIKPDDHEVLYNWGIALVAQARKKDGAEADELFTAAGEKYRQADVIMPGFGAYNMACIAALRGDEAACREQLNRSKDAGRLPGRSHMDSDADLDLVRDKDWFKEFMKNR